MKINKNPGVWQIIPIDNYWKEISQNNKEFDDKFYDSFFTNKSTTTLIYLHGNVGNRASLHRPFTYQELAEKNQFNVIAIDYAGFGDSEGKPTEKSVVEDSKAVWDWLIQKGASPDRLIIMGHSLGTAIATKLTEQLQSEKALPKALMLKAPFSNVKRAMFDFKLFGRIGVLGPLGRVPQLKSYITKVLKLDFDSLSIINVSFLIIIILFTNYT
jgi:abhydrolase domain-containing protein 12